MKKLHGLVISWYYPPGNSSEGLVTYKLLKNSSFTYDVFTRKSYNANLWDRQTDESALVSDNVTIHQANTDDEEEWVDEAVKFFKENADKYDFIMSRIMSEKAHLAAAKIKDEFPNVFWAASFGDPLVNSPYIEVIDKNDNPFFLRDYYLREQPSFTKLLHLVVSPTRMARKKVWEKERIDKMVGPIECERVNRITFDKADLLIFNNQYQYNRAFIDDYTKYKHKGIIVNHGFDLSLYPKGNTKKADSKIHFVYVGHLDSLRNARALFEALGILKEHDSELSKKVVFDFYGHIDDSDKVVMVNNHICDIVNLHNDIEYLDSLKKIREADWLVLIDANLNAELDEYIYFPAKLVDYFGARKNILAITQLRGASADAMREVGAGQVVTHSADEIAMYLAKIIYKDYRPASYNDTAWNKYNVRNVARNLDEKLVEHIGEEGANKKE